MVGILKRKPIYLSVIYIVFILGFLCFSVLTHAASVDYDPGLTVDTRTLAEKLEDFQNNSSSSIEEMPAGSWAYAAIKHFVDMGFVDGVEADKFRTDKPVTRYEMAIMVDKIFNKYLEWDNTGKITVMRKVTVEKPRVTLPDPLKEKVLEEVETKTEATKIDVAKEPARVEIAPAVAQPKTKDVVVIGNDGAKVTLTRTTPRSMGGSKEPLPDVNEVTGAKPPKEEAKKDEPVVAPAPAVAPVPEKTEYEERIEQVEKKIDLSQKDIDELEKLINAFKKELKDLNTSLSKSIKDVERISLKSKRDIEDLKQKYEKLKFSGSNSFHWETGGPITGDGGSGTQTTKLEDNFTLRIAGKPVESEDVTVSTSISAYNSMGARRGMTAFLEGSRSPLSISDLTVSYKNTMVDPKNPKNFRLRAISVGDTSAMFSPLTIFGRKLQGVSASFSLNDYTINTFGARTAVHPVRPQSMPSDVDFYYDSTQYDRYVYGITLNSPVLGEAVSMGNISKIWMQDNKNTNYPGCRLGYWEDLNLEGDPSAYTDPDNDISNQDFFCGPPEKNSVTSAFVRYPFPGVKNLFITAEYAHSTYYKPGYRAVKSEDYIHPDDVPSEDDIRDTIDVCQSSLSTDIAACESLVSQIVNYYNQYVCDTDNMDNSVFASGGTACWMQVKERNDQDDAFIFLFDYSKGPIKMFPIGYVKLGPEFVTKYFGLPGFDMDSMGMDMSVLPISLQSLEAYVLNFSIDELKEKNYSYSTYYVLMNEIQPMYFDVGALASGLSGNSSKATALDLLPKILARINNRKETLRLKVWTQSLKYNITDDINFEIGSTKVKAALPETCLDGEIITITNDVGETIDYQVGNGTANCSPDNLDDNPFALDVTYNTHSFKLYWKTSMKATFETNFGINDSHIVFYYPNVTAVAPLINDMVDQGKYYSLSGKFSYKLTSSTDLSLGYSTKYDRMPDSDDSEDSPVKDSMNISFSLNTNF